MTKPALQVSDLVKEYPLRGGRSAGVVHAVSGVSLSVDSGQTLGLVGESGCGKSSLARSIVRLTDVTSGAVFLHGEDLLTMRGRALRRARRRIQMVFQDPYTTLDPRMSVGSILDEALAIHGLYPRRREARVRELLDTVGLNPDRINRYPHEFSGGQRQRIGLARALAVEPEVIVLDEPLSALDVSIQSGIINLLDDLQEELGLSYLLIAHDLSAVRHLSTSVAVMYLGEIVESGPVDSVYEGALHPYTHALLSAVPIPDPIAERSRERILLTGDVPSAVNPPAGCRFHTRCAHATAVCSTTKPQLEDAGDGHEVACHHPALVSGSVPLGLPTVRGAAR